MQYSKTSLDCPLDFIIIMVLSTVEPLNNGHIGDECFVHYSEVVPYSEILPLCTVKLNKIALKCKTLGGILRCRLWMQTNALSRHCWLSQRLLWSRACSTMSTSSGFFVHTMKHCYATALYTTDAATLSITHARISLPHA